MNPCCSIYKAFIETVRPHELATLSEGKPAYAFAYSIEVVESLDNFCGKCGTPLKEGMTPVQVVKVAASGQILVTPEAPKQRVCPECKGQKPGTAESGAQIVCSTCLNKGFVVPQKPLPADTVKRLGELKAKLMRKQGAKQDESTSV